MPALLDKWERARLAVLGGCDLVLELPFAFACRSAQAFARGGVQLLARLGIIDTLAFGAETNRLELLSKAAQSIDRPGFQQQLHQEIASGLAYASAVEKLFGQESKTSFIRNPNNILALEYLRALKDAPALSPLLIQRQGAGYHSVDLHSPLPSASSLRLALYEGRLDEKAAKLAAPPATAARLMQLKAEELPQMARLYPALQLLLLRQSAENLKRVYGMEEGLENRLQEAASAPNYEAFIQRAVSRRYPATRLQRLALHMLLSLDKERVAAFESSGPLYARLLAAGPRGKEMLKDIKEKGTLPLITKTTQFLNSSQRQKKLQALTPLQQMLSFDTWATELRELTLSSSKTTNDFNQSPIFFR
jgi:predicted nucleotidyltransferase